MLRGLALGEKLLVAQVCQWHGGTKSCQQRCTLKYRLGISSPIPPKCSTVLFRQNANIGFGVSYILGFPGCFGQQKTSSLARSGPKCQLPALLSIQRPRQPGERVCSLAWPLFKRPGLQARNRESTAVTTVKNEGLLFN